MAESSDERVVRVVLADDHPVLREGLRGLLDAQPDIRVVGEAKDGEEACRAAKELSPDVLVMDISMPVLGGEESRMEPLSARERDVLVRIARGYSNKEIAAALVLSVKTVETYKARVAEKLGLTSRVEIVRYAAKRGWLEES